MEFADESVEVLNHVMNDVLELNNKTNCESINNIFRAFHSMKGNSRMLGFERLGAFGHKAEDVLSLVRNGIIVVDKPIIDLLLHTLDMMILILGDIRAGAGDGRDTTKAIAALDNILTLAAQSKKIPSESLAKWDSSGCGSRKKHRGRRYIARPKRCPSRFTTGNSTRRLPESHGSQRLWQAQTGKFAKDSYC